MGHINPSSHLARRLLSVGFSLTIIHTQPFHKFFQQCWDPKINSNIRLLSVPDPLHGQVGLDSILSFINSPQLQVRESVQLIIEEIKQEISCIIYDPFYHWSPNLAEQYGITCVAFFTSSVVSSVVNGQVARLLEEGLIPVKRIAATRAAAPKIYNIPGVSPFNAFDLPNTLHNIEDNPDPDYKYRILRHNQLKKASWVLANTFEELEAEVLEASRLLDNPNFIAVGPLVWPRALGEKDKDELNSVSAIWEEDQTCLKWLDAQAPSSVLYIAFGSLANLDEEKVVELACGLELSEQPFLWACRTNLITRSSKGFLNDFIARIEKRGLVITWAPQVEILRHPSVGGFLTHCGWNSILEGICAGVPLLGIPCLGEQPINCYFIADVWKIGLRLCDNDVVEKLEVAEKIKRLMIEEEGHEMKRRAQRLKVAATSAFSGSSYKNLAMFVAAIKSKKEHNRILLVDA